MKIHALDPEPQVFCTYPFLFHVSVFKNANINAQLVRVATSHGMPAKTDPLLFVIDRQFCRRLEREKPFSRAGDERVSHSYKTDNDVNVKRLRRWSKEDRVSLKMYS
jgi:hypothetical protein